MATSERRPARPRRTTQRVPRVTLEDEAATTASTLTEEDPDEGPTEVHDPRCIPPTLVEGLAPAAEEDHDTRPEAFGHSFRASTRPLEENAGAAVSREPPPLPPLPRLPSARRAPDQHAVTQDPAHREPKAADTLPPPLPDPPMVPRRSVTRRSRTRGGSSDGMGSTQDFATAATPHRVSLPAAELPVVRLGEKSPKDSESSADGVPFPRDQSEVTNQLRLPGLIDGRYQIAGPLGEGGMGRVLKVVHRALNKEFALKIVRAQLSDDWRAREAFFREARVLSSLSHPNIVMVTDFGVDPNFGAFIVMELLTGETLLQRINREGRLPLKAACDIILQVAEAVRFIHSNNIIHCDLKSENVYLYQPVAEPRRRNMVKLMDFGLSRSWEGGTDRTREKEIAGTPTYLAPERIEGKPPAPSNDIYAMGVLFYEMITGRPPFVGTINQVLDAHLDEEPVPPSKRIPEPIEERADEIIIKALAKDPAKRQRDAAAFVYEVRTLMDMLGIKHKRRYPVPGRAPVFSGMPSSMESRLRLYEEAYEEAPLPLVVLGPKGEALVANRTFLRIMGITPQEAARLTLEGTPLGTQNPRVLEEFKRVVATGRSSQIQVEFYKESRRQRAVLLLVPARDNHGVSKVHVVLYPIAMPRPPSSSHGR